MFSDKLNCLTVSAIKQIEIEASKLSGVVSLAQGIPSFDTPEPIKNRVKEILDKGWSARYSLTNGLPLLREMIAEKLRSQNIFIDYEEEIIITVGAAEALAAALIAIINPCDEVLIASPTYAAYSEIIKVAGGKPVFSDLDEKSGWSLDIKNIKQQIHTNTKAILLCNPNNPTGTIYSKRELLELADIASKRNIFILLDEVYRDFIYSHDRPFFSLAELPELKTRVIRIFSFSKLYAMTGWRIGYIHSHRENIRQILKVHDSLVTCAPVISQYAAIAALSLTNNEMKPYLETYKKRREITCNFLDALSGVMRYHIPESTYFLFPEIVKPHISSWELALDILDKVRVASVPGVSFGPSGEHHLRFMFGGTEEHLTDAFQRLQHYFKKYV